ncbi:membrane metallo-endopeptidase-like 1 [Dermacentor silvarum]|uniref:membrane metallo-endopeptidase-like 1 n=1 Tax=Dermacentor silvarum TaxID=543639 RepID=UPI00189A85FF|nr:membrane metallo-endopeptidase-like 1 [Dermacentor silvarum]
MDAFIWSQRPPSSTLRAFVLHSFVVLVVTALLLATVLTMNLARIEEAIGFPASNKTRRGLLSHASERMLFCDAKQCEYEARFLNASVDWSLNPCDDFYKYACSRWKGRHHVPNYSDERSLFTVLRRALDMDVLSILNATLLPEELQTPNQKAAALLAGCIDRRQLNRLGVAPFARLLDRHGLSGWPHSNPKPPEPALLVGELTRRLRLQAFFSTTVSVHPKDVSRRMIHFDEPRTLLSKAMLLEMNVLEKYRLLVTNMMHVFRDSDENIPNNVLQMEIQLVMATDLTWKRKRKHAVKVNLASLPQSHKWNWALFLKTVAGDLLDVSNDTQVVSGSPEFFSRLASILNNASRKAITDYAAWRLLVHMAPFLPDAFRPLVALSRNADEEGRSTSAFAAPPRWRTCYERVADLMQYAVAAAYAQRFLVGKASALRKDVKKKYALFSERVLDVVRKSRWIHAKSSQVIQQRIISVTPYFLYPSFVENDYAISAFYHVVPDVQVGAVLESYYNTRSALNDHYWQWLVEDWIGPEWEAPFLRPQVYFNQEFNTLAVPFGILQSPLYYTNMLPPVDAARFGFQLVRELTRAFIASGPFYKERKSVKKPWDRLTQEEFRSRHNCFLHQYGQVYGKQINPYASITENILDNAALPIVYRVYRKLVRKSRSLGATDWVLKQLPEVSSDRIFFLAFATMFCDLKRTRALKLQLTHGPFSPSNYRVNVPLINFPKFAQAFGCGPDDAMVREEQCSLWD